MRRLQLITNGITTTMESSRGNIIFLVVLISKYCIYFSTLNFSFPHFTQRVERSTCCRVWRDLYRFHETRLCSLDGRYRLEFDCKLCSDTRPKCSTLNTKPILRNYYAFALNEISPPAAFVSSAWSKVNPNGSTETRPVVLLRPTFWGWRELTLIICASRCQKPEKSLKQQI